MILKVFFTKHVKILAWPEKKPEWHAMFCYKTSYVITCFCALFVWSMTSDCFIAYSDTEHLGFLVLSKGLTNQFAIQANAQLLLSESPNKQTKLTIWQQTTIEITPMITLLLRVHTTYNIYGCNSLPTTRSWSTMHSTSRQEVTKKTFTANFLHKLNFCWRRFN